MCQYYREFTCIACGGKGIDRGSKQDAKFCSPKCRQKYNNSKRDRSKKPVPVCRYNGGVLCEIHQCDGCGWSPKVQYTRMKKVWEEIIV